MRKSIIIAIIVLSAFTLAFITVFAAKNIGMQTNQDNLNNLMTEFSRTVEDVSGGEIIEEVSVYGKLNGNGNGIQYFGAVLVYKDTIDDINLLMEELDKKFEIVEYWNQEGNNIDSKYLEHQKLSYTNSVDKKRECISICFFQSRYAGSDFLDIKGH